MNGKQANKQTKPGNQQKEQNVQNLTLSKV